jgi:L,D-transpeptidase ErfK/SrfK
MYPEDIEKLYNVTPVGTPVYIVKQPIKVGWLDNMLYIEAHPDLEGEEMSQDERYAVALNLIQKANNNELPEFDQKVLNEVLAKLDGEPIAIYERLPPLEETLDLEPADPLSVQQTPAKPMVPQASASMEQAANQNQRNRQGSAAGITGDFSFTRPLSKSTARHIINPD